MGDAVLRVQRHLQELARDNFARLEAAHGANVDWLHAELVALARDVGAALARELKRPAPAAFRSNEYAFAGKKARVETPRTPEPVAAPATATATAEVSTRTEVPALSTVSAPAEVSVSASPTAAAATVAKKKKTVVVRRIRRVMRPKAAPASVRGAKAGSGRPRLDPVSMKVVDLRAELKRRGLKAAGLKAVLVDRLLEAMENDDDDEEEEDGASDVADDVVELEEVDEEYDEEVEEEEEEAVLGGISGTTSANPVRSPTRTSSDEIVRESLDDASLLSQRSTHDESVTGSLSQASEADEKRPQSAFVPHAAGARENGEETRREDPQIPEATGGAEPTRAPEEAPTTVTAAAKKPASKWTFIAGVSRRDPSTNGDQGARVPAPEHLDDPNTGKKLNTSGESLGARNENHVVDAQEGASRLLADANVKSSRSTIAGESAVERKTASLKVSFAAKKGDAVAPDVQGDATHSETSTNQPSWAEDPVTRLRSISLPQTSVSVTADPVTPNGQGTTDELLVVRSEPGPGAPDETEEERQKREHQLTIEREAQRLRIAAKLSAKKRFEEAMLSSSFWAKRDRSKPHPQPQQQPQQLEPVPDDQPAKDALAEDAAASALKVAIKVEPEAEASTLNPPFVATAPSPTSDSSSHTAQASLKQEPPVRSKAVKIPFSSSHRRFSDPSRRLSASRRRDSTLSRRDSTSSSRRDSTQSSRRNSLTRRRDSGSSSTMSSGSQKSSSSSSQKTDAATGARKPTNLISGLHSFTSLVEKENASASGPVSARSAPVVNALKMAEKTRLMEQKKNFEKMKRKEALMKKYEEQRKLDDDKKKKALGIKEKAERDAKLKREQDKLNEKKQREIELAKRRHQKLQEMRAGLEKKRAMLAAEKQAGAARLAASTVSFTSSNRRISTSSASAPAPRPGTATQVPAPKPSAAVLQVPAKQSAPSQTVHSAKPGKPSASVQVPKATSSHATSAATAAPPAKPAAPPHPKDRPTDTSTYDMSENGESSGSDGDDSDDDESKHNKKNIPRWARKENLERILRVQFGPNASDPSPAIFPDFVDTCDLEAIFQPTDVRKKKRFQKRSSSGNWFGDRPTAREKAVYKRDMGYLR